jgi:hypothetical protein
MEKEKIILLNALVTSSKIPLMLKTKPSNLDEVKKLIENKEIVSFIGHEATAQLLSVLLNRSIQTNRSMYDPHVNDIAIVVKLKRRLEKPEDVRNITVSDVEFILVEYHEYK